MLVILSVLTTLPPHTMKRWTWPGGETSKWMKHCEGKSKTCFRSSDMCNSALMAPLWKLLKAMCLSYTRASRNTTTKFWHLADIGALQCCARMFKSTHIKRLEPLATTHCYSGFTSAHFKTWFRITFSQLLVIIIPMALFYTFKICTFIQLNALFNMTPSFVFCMTKLCTYQDSTLSVFYFSLCHAVTQLTYVLFQCSV